MSYAKRVGAALAPRVTQIAPNLSATFVHQALARRSAGWARCRRGERGGQAAHPERRRPGPRLPRRDREPRPVRRLQGFLTNLGGLVTMAVTVPTNITGLALIQCRMVAGMVHLRGYDLDDPRTRAAILTCLLGEDMVVAGEGHTLPGRRWSWPARWSTTLADAELANEVASELIARAAGKRLATTVGRRVPVVGGVVGASTDAYVPGRSAGTSTASSCRAARRPASAEGQRSVAEAR